jgi:hypothetical protein
MNNLTTHIAPVVAITGYFLYPKELRINPYLLHGLSILHNGILVVFSTWTFLSLAEVLYNDGLVFQSGYYFENPQFDTIIYYFYLSKYYEFLDTFLLYLNGKNPIFLQKYHHVGTAILFHFCYVYKIDAVWTATLINSFVHMIMYSYYLGCLLKIEKVRIIRQYITSLQLVQFSTFYADLYLYRPPFETWFNYYIILLFGVYGTGMVGLFGKFYHDSYIRLKEKEAPEKKIN